jgi:hypothetical protein
MAGTRRILMDIASTGYTPSEKVAGPDRMPRTSLSEFERAQIGKIAAEGAVLAADVVLWHRLWRAAAMERDLELRLSHGLGVAALGALIMQIRTWIRLLEGPEPPASTLRSAREIIDGPDPTADPLALDWHARSMLRRASGIKARARHISRLW